MVNHMTLQGRMVADPELRDTNSGAKVVNFRVAWSEKYKDKENKCFMECKAFGPQAEFLCKYFAKGHGIIVEGKIYTEEWTTQEGQKRNKNVLMVGGIHFDGSKKDSGAGATQTSNPLADGELPF